MRWLKKIKEFSSYFEYERFTKYLADRLYEGEIEEIEPKEYYHGKSMLYKNEDRWFRERLHGDIWRLVPPDFPFKGFFEKLEYPMEGYKKKTKVN